MRRIHALLLVAGLAAAQTSAHADRADSSNHDQSVQVVEWSTSKGRLGIMLMGLTPELRTHYGATSDAGVLVARVEPGSPADKAGVRVGDVLTKTNEQLVDDAFDVRSTITGAKKGEAVTLSVVRDRKPFSFKATLTDDAPPPMPRFESFSSRDWFRDFMKPFEEIMKQHRPAKT